jgi:hypothetical protein
MTTLTGCDSHFIIRLQKRFSCSNDGCPFIGCFRVTVVFSSSELSIDPTMSRLIIGATHDASQQGRASPAGVPKSMSGKAPKIMPGMLTVCVWTAFAWRGVTIFWTNVLTIENESVLAVSDGGDVFTNQSKTLARTRSELVGHDCESERTDKMRARMRPLLLCYMLSSRSNASPFKNFRIRLGSVGPVGPWP